MAKLKFTIDRKRKLVNRLEELFVIDLTQTIYSFNSWGGDPSDFRTRVEELVKEYRSKAVDNKKTKSHFKLKTYWPLSGSGKFLNSGSLMRQDDNSGTPIITLSWN